MVNETILPGERERFLSLIEIPRRATVTNLFLKPARDGITDPDAVVQGVLDLLREKIAAPWASDASRTRDSLTLGIVEQHPGEATDFARWAVSYVEQPAEARQHHKREEREQHVNAWLQRQPPTERQIAFLRGLGHTGEVQNKLEASGLIESLRQGGTRL